MGKNTLILLIILLPFLLDAQDYGLPLITNYYPSDYHAESQIFDIEQDSLGKVYFSNTIGILEFDGRTWRRHELPGNAFPRNIELTKSGKFYTAGEGFLYKITVDEYGNFQYKSLLDVLPDKYRDFYTIWRMAANDSLIYIDAKGDILQIKNDSICKVFKTSASIYNFNLIDGYLYVSQHLQLAVISPQGQIDTFPMDFTPFGIYKKNDSIFFVTSKLEVKSFVNKQIKDYAKLKLKLYGTTYLSSFEPISDNNYVLYTYNKGCYIFDSTFTQELYLSSQKGLASNTLYSWLIDKSSNLWLGTDNGISYIEYNTPLRIIDERLGFKVFSPSFLGKFYDNYMIFSGDEIISVKFDDSLKIEKIPFLNQCWQGIQIGDLFYTTTNPGLLKIDKNFKTEVLGGGGNNWSIMKWHNHYIISANEGVFIYDNVNGNLEPVKKLDTIKYGCRFLITDTTGFVWTSYKDGAIRFRLDSDLNVHDLKFYGPEQGLKNYGTVQFFKWKDKFLFSTDKTIYQYDYAKDTILPFHELLNKFPKGENKAVYIVQIDSFNNIWLNYDDGVNYNYIAYREENGNFVEKYQFSRRMQKAFLQIGVEPNITNYKNFILFFSDKGVFLLDTTRQNILSKNFKTLIKKVILTKTDSVIYTDYSHKHNIVINYDDNNLRFEFTTPYYVLPQRILYRYRLLNYDKNWSAWSNEIYTSYTNLPPGEYIFEVQSKNIYGQTSDTTTLAFTVLPPWYLKWWAFILDGVIFILIIIGAVRFFTYRLKRKNEKLEALVKERTKEITMKNSELEQQKEEILAQAEELAIVNQELEKLSTVVRETDNAVIITDAEGNFIWVNAAFTKMFGYTFDELVNTVSKNIVSDQTDPQVKALVQKCIDEKTTVEYELKVRNKFNKEIWVHTTLTPILDDEGNITSIVAIDSDITEIKIAERKIREQRDQITASIRYAQSIQESILPQKEFLEKLFDIDIIYKPKDIVSGDFYWISNVFKYAEDHLTRVTKQIQGFDLGHIFYFALADCTGHGVPGAFMSLIGNHLLRLTINEMRIENPVDVLYKMDNEIQAILHRNDRQNMDSIVLSLLKFEKILKNGKEVIKVEFAGAGQDILYYKKIEDEFVRLKGATREIGYRLNPNLKFSKTEFILEQGDVLFLYSDGIKDLTAPDRKSLGFMRVQNLLKKIPKDNTAQIGQNIRKLIDDWTQGTPMRDDLTFITIKF